MEAIETEVDMAVDSTFEDITSRTRSAYLEVFGSMSDDDDIQSTVPNTEREIFGECSDFQDLPSFENSPVNSPERVLLKLTPDAPKGEAARNVVDKADSTEEGPGVVVLDNGKLKFIYDEEDLQGIPFYGPALLPEVYFPNPSSFIISIPTPAILPSISHISFRLLAQIHNSSFTPSPTIQTYHPTPSHLQMITTTPPLNTANLHTYLLSKAAHSPMFASPSPKHLEIPPVSSSPVSTSAAPSLNSAIPSFDLSRVKNIEDALLNTQERVTSIQRDMLMMQHAIQAGFNELHLSLRTLRADMEVRDWSRDQANETLLGKFKTEVRRTLNHGSHGPEWLLKQTWEESFWKLVKKHQDEAADAIQEEKIQKVLNVKLMHENNNLRVLAGLEPVPNLPPRDEYAERRAEEIRRQREEAEHRRRQAEADAGPSGSSHDKEAGPSNQDEDMD